MKFKQLVLTRQQVTAILREVYPTLPKDAHVSSVWLDGDALGIVIESDEFPDSRGKRPGTPLPTWKP